MSEVSHASCHTRLGCLRPPRGVAWCAFGVFVLAAARDQHLDGRHHAERGADGSVARVLLGDGSATRRALTEYEKLVTEKTKKGYAGV